MTISSGLRKATLLPSVLEWLSSHLNTTSTETAMCLCVMVNPADNAKTVSKSFLPLMINGQLVQFVREFRYLGHTITSDMRDGSAKRKIRNVYMRTNLLIESSRHTRALILFIQTLALYK